MHIHIYIYLNINLSKAQYICGYAYETHYSFNPDVDHFTIDRANESFLPIKVVWILKSFIKDAIPRPVFLVNHQFF